MSTSGQIKLRPLVPSDIDECARVAAEAFEKDKQTQFKSCSAIDPYNHEESMRGALNHWLGRPPGSVDMTVAIDSQSDEILGWNVWGFRGFEAPPSSQPQANTSEGKQAAQEPSSTTTASSTKQEPPNPPSPPQSMKQRLEEFTSTDLKTWMDRLMPPGTKCMFVCTIAVSPRHHGKGVGRMLLDKGLARADTEKVFCWVHASEAGANFFSRMGFREVGKLDLDLDAYNTEKVEPPDGAREWGGYTFRYMRREARASS